MRRPRVLVAEQDDVLRHTLCTLLFREGCEVLESSNKLKSLRTFRQKTDIDLMIVSSSLGPQDPNGGVELTQQIRQSDKRIRVILLVRESSEEKAISALRLGVNDYLKQPVLLTELAASVRRCLADCFSAQPTPQAGVDAVSDESEQLIGQSPVMQKVKRYIEKVALTTSSILITGETGTGKELAAAVIHAKSPRRFGPFVCLNCAAIPDSLLESELFGYERGAFTGAESAKEGQLQLADHGTLFLDEVGDMTPFAQAKVLRALESKHVQRLGGKTNIPLDFRVIAATNQDLERLMAEGRFRRDLYFRLNVLRIHLPPLRERKGDVVLLLRHYIQELNRQFGQEVQGCSKETLAYLSQYDWPGNIRELRNLLEAVFVDLNSHEIALDDLPVHFRRRPHHVSYQTERERLVSTLLETQWNKSQAAQKLQWSRVTLYRKLAKYNIQPGADVSKGDPPPTHNALQ